MKKQMCCLIVLAGMTIAGIQQASAAQGTPQGTVNINTATTKELMVLPGIGKAKAEAIIAARQQNKFATREDLMKVHGIGKALFQKVAPYVQLNGPTTLKAAQKAKRSPQTSHLDPRTPVAAGLV